MYIIRSDITGDSSDTFRMGRRALSLVLVGVLSNYFVVVVNCGASVEEVLTNCTEDNVEEWREKVNDLEELMKTLEDENKYLKFVTLIVKHMYVSIYF
jgi:hypothetical protein